MPRSTPAMISSRRGAVGRRLQRHVRHPLHRHVAGRVGEGAAVGARHPAQPGHVPVDLVPDEDAVLHDVPLLAGDALVVPADGGQPVRGGAVAGDVHQRRAVLQAAELVDGRERRPGVGGLVAERPVELGGVPDRLVDGQEQVGRVDDEVVAAGLDRRRLRLLAQQLGDLGQLAAPVPGVAGEVLPAAADRRGEGAHALERAGGAVDGERGELRVDADALLAGAGAGGVGVVLLLLHVHAAALHVLDAVGGHQLLGQLDEQGASSRRRAPRTGRSRSRRPRSRRRRPARARARRGRC